MPRAGGIAPLIALDVGKLRGLELQSRPADFSARLCALREVNLDQQFYRPFALRRELLNLDLFR